MKTYIYTNAVNESKNFSGDSMTINGTIVTISSGADVVAFINLAPSDFIRTVAAAS